MDLTNIKAVIFDFDGTLYNFEGLVKKLLSELDFKGILYANRERAVRSRFKGKFFGSGEGFYAAYFSELAKSCLTSPGKIQKWFRESYMQALLHVLQKYCTARDGVPKLFETLRTAGIKTAVFSDYALVKERLNAVGISENAADFLFSAEELGGLKPAKEPFLEIARQMETPPENILVVGDRSDTDGDGAKQGGMHFVQIKTHKTKEEETDAVEWEDFSEQMIAALESVR